MALAYNAIKQYIHDCFCVQFQIVYYFIFANISKKIYISHKLYVYFVKNNPSLSLKTHFLPRLARLNVKKENKLSRCHDYHCVMIIRIGRGLNLSFF